MFNKLHELTEGCRHRRDVDNTLTEITTKSLNFIRLSIRHLGRH